jgi:hypothetical protein
LTGHLTNAAGPVPLVFELRIAHERFGSSSGPNINGHLHYPNDIDRSLNQAAVDKIRKYRADYNNYFYKIIGKLTAFLQLQEFSLSNPTVTSSTTAAPRSPPS